MRFFPEFQINGKPILVPDGDVELTLTDLDSGSAGRDESGVMHRIRVRKRVKTWTFQYFALTREEFQYMEQLLSETAAFQFVWQDAEGNSQTCSAYCSNTGLTYQNARQKLYRNYKFTVIEC